MDVGSGGLQELVMDREAWRASVQGVTKSRKWLSNWTEEPSGQPNLFLRLQEKTYFPYWSNHHIYLTNVLQAIFSHIIFKFVFKVIFKIKLLKLKEKKKKDSRQRHRMIQNSSPSRDTGILQLYMENCLWKTSSYPASETEITQKTEERQRSCQKPHCGAQTHKPQGNSKPAISPRRVKDLYPTLGTSNFKTCAWEPRLCNIWL